MFNIIDVVMRSKNEGSYVGPTIAAVRAQKGPWTVRLTVIDSGSTDGSLELFRQLQVERLIQIEHYVAGAVLNQGMRETTGDWVVFLNADATPADEHWLANLLAAAQAAPRTGATFSRQLPRPDCQAIFAHDYDRCFGPKRESAQWDHFFSMVSSVVYRPAWTAHPFRDDLTYAEDDEWSRRLVRAGWSVPYADTSQVIHSHNYTPKQSYKRCYGDCFALAATSPTPVRNYNYHHTVALGAAKDALKDWRWCAAQGRYLEWPHAALIRLSQRLGKRDGYHAGWRHFGRDRPASLAKS